MTKRKKKRCQFGEHWANDPRLPDDADATERIYGAKRPKQAPPWQAPSAASCVFRRRGKAPVKLEVVSNRTKKKWWFTALVGFAAREKRPHDPNATVFMVDYASTTSPKVAEGWIAAVNACGRRSK